MEKQTPFGAFRFLVEVGDSGSVAAAFTQFSGVKLQVQTLQARTGEDSRGVQEFIPTFTSFAPVTLTKGVVRDNAFIDWLFAAAAGINGGPSGEKLRRTLSVIALDGTGERGVSWTLKDALPIGYELAPMDGGRSGVLSESLTFAITGMERKKESEEPPEPPPPDRRNSPHPLVFPQRGPFPFYRSPADWRNF